MLFLYDNTFEGFLSVIFECYSRKIEPVNICPEKNHQEILFIHKEKIITDLLHADRVWKGLQKKLTPDTCQLPYTAFLSGETGIEMALYRFIKLVFASPVPITSDYGNPDVLMVRKAARKVMLEAMRMVQFIRFQLTLDDIYFAPVNPAYDVLPMILQQFKSRFADQVWLIYDLRRDYGFFYDHQTIEEVTLSEKSFSAANGNMPSGLLQEDEAVYQRMWNDYCQSITIRERLNLKLQKQHMPKRYWKFLPEKKVVKIPVMVERYGKI
jgi:probable DNA metabolism protein